MFQSLKERVVVVSGGSSGIGKAVVNLLAQYGMKVALLYNNTAIQQEELDEKNKKYTGEIRQYHVDVKSKDSIINVLREVEKDYGKIDFLVNSAGIVKDTFMLLMSDEDYNGVIDTNLKGSFMMIQAALPYLLGSKEGAAVVNISSIAGLKGVSGQTNYCASKAGLIGMTKALAKEMASKNIRFNAVAPGYIETKMTEKIASRDVAKVVPMKRMGNPEEIASVVLFLLSDGASYINGETIVVDGGMIA